MEESNVIFEPQFNLPSSEIDMESQDNSTQNNTLLGDRVGDYTTDVDPNLVVV